MSKILTLNLKKSTAEFEKRKLEEQRITAQKVLEAAYDNPVELNDRTLTLGCEFECIVARFRPGMSAKDEDWAKEQVRKALSQSHLTTCSG